ncbi:D-alanyl-D-alanine carboxypeptidase family protein [Virgibacillus siamensis]|uniref:D-alanyl-D-alanine carboxypeptidase family protein n=1 Tax=Virgibacillus siamensis TaxID=480071 RepID=UPI000986E204|nr:D-alanyl-D-alanine carboxypeptidase family protein [Virgibacillus siamensis]
MLKKVLPITAVLIAVIGLMVACDNGQSTDNQAANQSPNDEKNTNHSEEQEAALPQPVLEKTDQGEDVKALQKVLNKLGYQIPVNSNFDEMTTWAITDFQMQQKDMPITGIYNKTTKQKLQKTLDTNGKVNPGAALEQPDDNQKIASNPHEILVLVNKEHSLPNGFKPKNLVVPDVQFPFDEFREKKQMRKVAATALGKLFNAADNAGLELYAQSGYRSYERQDAIFASNVEAYGEKAANNVSARPGESEHQTGLTMDVTTPDVGFNLNTDFGTTDEGKWLKEHAAEYGFIIRYPKGKENITQYQYEPWHLRYVGEKAATEIMNKGITLEEFLGKK